MRGPLSLTAVAALSMMATQLGGCVAVALVPLAAGGTLTGSQLAGRKAAKPTAEKQVTPVVIVGQGTSSAPLASTSQPAPPISAPSQGVTATEPASDAGSDQAVPAQTPEPESESGGFAAMASYVLSAVEAGKAADKAGGKRTSALLDQGSLVLVPKTKPCGRERGALLIDLDPGTKAFDLDDPPLPAPGLAEYLRTIRGTGIAVVWIATLPEASAKQLGTILKATGLDPLGIDQVLLLRRNETRKQQILLRADEDFCVLAIAGDRKADFDEVFDYLRNPDGPVAVALEQNIGAGWFLVPPPIK